jgi:hypothetical protein
MFILAVLLGLGMVLALFWFVILAIVVRPKTTEAFDGVKTLACFLAVLTPLAALLWVCLTYHSDPNRLEKERAEDETLGRQLSVEVSQWHAFTDANGMTYLHSSFTITNNSDDPVRIADIGCLVYYDPEGDRDNRDPVNYIFDNQVIRGHGSVSTGDLGGEGMSIRPEPRSVSCKIGSYYREHE